MQPHKRSTRGAKKRVQRLPSVKESQRFTDPQKKGKVKVKGCCIPRRDTVPVLYSLKDRETNTDGKKPERGHINSSGKKRKTPEKRKCFSELLP